MTQTKCNTNTLETARLWNQAGYFLIPLIWKSKFPHAPLIERATGQTGWKPLAGFKYQTPAIIKSWFAYPAVNIGVIVGEGLCVLDFDNWEAWDRWEHKGEFPEIATSRGVHVYFRNDHIQTTSKLTENGQEIGDLKGNGYVVTAPSIHESGVRYRWRNEPDDYGNIPYVVNIDWFLAGLKAERTPSRQSMGIPIQPVDIVNPFAYSAQRIVDIPGITVTKHSTDGAFAHGPCPLHQDNHPSFWIHLETNRWGCWKCGYKNASAALLRTLMGNQDVA